MYFSHLFWSYLSCIGVAFRKLVLAKVKVSSNLLKFCKGCFCDVPKHKKLTSCKIISSCKNKYPTTHTNFYNYVCSNFAEISSILRTALKLSSNRKFIKRFEGLPFFESKNCKWPKNFLSDLKLSWVLWSFILINKMYITYQ